MLIKSHLNSSINVAIEKRNSTLIIPAFHSHELYEMYILLEGQRKIYIGKPLYTTISGDVALVPPNTPHRSFGEAAYKGICIEFSDELLKAMFLKEELQNLYSLFQKNIISLPEQVVNEIKIMSEQVVNKEIDEEMYLRKIVSILYSYAGFSDSRAKLTMEDDISPIGTYIQKHYMEIQSLDELVEHFGMTKSYLCRLFKKQTGISIITYINSLKVQKACWYLQHSDLQVKEIAVKCDFKSVIYFNRVFKKIMENTPEEIRKIARDSGKYSQGESHDLILGK